MTSTSLSKRGKFKSKLRKWYVEKRIPRGLSDNFITLDGAKVALMQRSLLKTTFPPGVSIDSPEVQKHLDLLAGRFQSHCAQIIPWLNSIKSLKGLRILEIGCGNGTSTVALAEQGAVITAIDIEAGLLRDAEERCRIYGVPATFHLLNATEVSDALAGKEFDMILFFAVLEHMTYEERLTAIRQTYGMLAPGGLWSIIDMPNRLHCFNSHTTILPF